MRLVDTTTNVSDIVSFQMSFLRALEEVNQMVDNAAAHPAPVFKRFRDLPENVSLPIVSAEPTTNDYGDAVILVVKADATVRWKVYAPRAYVALLTKAAIEINGAPEGTYILHSRGQVGRGYKMDLTMVSLIDLTLL